jgi:hypothetical protein
MAMVPLADILNAQVVGGQVISRAYTGANLHLGDVTNDGDVVVLNAQGEVALNQTAVAKAKESNIEDAEIVEVKPRVKRVKPDPFADD